jgi:hypothetical protein
MLAGNVEGKVVSTTGWSVGGATVVLFDGESKLYQGFTEAWGLFKIANVAPGNYRIRVIREGYRVPVADQNQFPYSGLRVGPDSDPVEVALKLEPLNAIRGRVIGQDGKPVGKVEVSLGPDISQSITTDPEGRFELEDVTPGRHTLIAYPDPIDEPSMEAPDGTRIARVKTYYPTATIPSLAEYIAFNNLGVLSGYEIRMQTAPVVRMRGIVLGIDGKPSSMADVIFLPAERHPEHLAEGWTLTGEDGRFELPAVRVGDWTIEVSSSTNQECGTGDVHVGQNDLDGLEIRLRPCK